ncbi:MAG: hypothetical protein AAFN78_17890, partial [Pseudomonadota bacterium]
LVIDSGRLVNAVGLSITSIDALEAGDLTLLAGGTTVDLDPEAIQSILSDGAREYFLGIVSSVAFSSIRFRTVGGGYFLYTIDDITIARAADDDSDGVADAVDNCLALTNPTQIDTDADAIGNACDPDIAIPNDCQVNFADLGALKFAFFSVPGEPAWNPDADFTADDQVNFADLGVMKQQFFGPPGPSALPNACAR